MLARVRKIILKSLFYFILLTNIVVITFKFFPIPITMLMIIRTIEQGLDNNRNIKLVKTWTPFSQIPNDVKLAAICAEDQNFMEHEGFDLDAIENAIQKNKTSKRTKGASTISQQTAKNIFLWPKRSWFRKGLEVYFTFLIELYWSKERILEVYLNIVELDDGVYGFPAACTTFYNKKIQKINREQAALLVAKLPSPLHYKIQPPSKYMLRRQNWILRQMNNYGTYESLYN